jgi:hypothetical protein
MRPFWWLSRCSTLLKRSTANKCHAARVVTYTVACEEQHRLLNLYRAKVSAYSAAVNDVTLTRDKIMLQEYYRLAAVTEKARTASEAALAELKRRTEEHTCWSLDSDVQSDFHV